MLQLKTSSIVVYFSTTYSDFQILAANREINQGKINRIKKDIEIGIDVLRYCPILVVVKKDSFGDDKLFILDGQHRFWVAKQLGKPVHFVIVTEEMDMYSIASVNSNTDKWKPEDYINCYVAFDNLSYKTIQWFMDTYRMQLTVSLSLLEKGTIKSDGGYSRGKDFEKGKFVVKCKDRAVEIAECCKRFEKFSYYRNRNFVIAICKIMEAAKVSMDELVAKFEKCTEDLTPQATYKDYLVCLEMLFNKNNRQRKPIF
jgi:hypothetical protein